MIPAWLFAAGLAVLALRNREAQKRPLKPMPTPKRNGASKPASPALSAVSTEIQAALQSPAWSADSKAILEKVKGTLPGASAEKERESYDLLKTLPEDERGAYAMERGTSFGKSKWSEASGYAMAGWVYLHTGGLSKDLVQMGQEKMGLSPANGELTPPTVRAMKERTGRPMWFPVLAQWGAGEEGI